MKTASARPARDQILPSGRTVRIRASAEAEELEVRSPSGEVEVKITLTAAGPVVRLRSARLELEAAEDVAVRCRRFEVQASDEVRLRAAGDVHVNGEVVRLNCQ
jgi:hypothetical protein